MSKTKKLLLTLLGVFLIIFTGVVILVFSFTQSMKADPDEEKKVRDQAERYLEKTFDETTEIYDVLYDNMGNWGYFDYAAKVKQGKWRIHSYLINGKMMQKKKSGLMLKKNWVTY
ncbi:hypothetical protein [Peribacillus simplex]|uniref:hypothetical protein n=1 Tax=Peribacillus simplex TaxID=1478 RepID=UPI0021AAFFFE|nr:hypothetical protein [Peribacillus simplex]